MVLCGRLSWLLVCFWAHVNVVSYRIVTVKLEDLQGHVLQIIAGNTLYQETCHLSNISALADKRTELCRMLNSFWTNYQRRIPHTTLFVISQAGCSVDWQAATVRSATTYPTVCARTNRFKNSLRTLDLSNFQCCRPTFSHCFFVSCVNVYLLFVFVCVSRLPHFNERLCHVIVKG